MKEEDIEILGKRIAQIAEAFRSSTSQIEALLNQTKGQLGILFYLNEHPEGTSSGELAEVMHVGTGRIGNALKAMQQRGTINRRIDPDDNRRIIVTITDYGRQLITARRREFIDSMGYVLDAVGYDKLSAMLDTLEEIARVQDQYLKKSTKRSM